MDTTLKSTCIIEPPPEPMPLWRAFYNGAIKLLQSVWTSTHFEDPSITRYAEERMVTETRKGITVMAVLSLLMQVAAIGLYQKLGVNASFLYTYGLLALLSVHVMVSARYVSDLSALNLLGMILLIATGIAIMAIAHRTGSLNAGLMSSIVLLFMVMPLVPWGLREATVVVLLSYMTITLSFFSVEGRFDQETLWTVQFLIVASATTATLTIIRNTIVRKDDMRSKYMLEEAHKKLELISMRDPLTGAWNRRFIEQNFDPYAQAGFNARQQVKLALLDIDKFKHFNDSYGHHCGDLILQHLAKIVIDTLPGNNHLIRLGGDEFAILYKGDGFDQLVDRCLKHLATDPILLEQTNGEPVTVAVGYAVGGLDVVANLTSLYIEADEALYKAKNERPHGLDDDGVKIPELVSTGSASTKA